LVQVGLQAPAEARDRRRPPVHLVDDEREPVAVGPVHRLHVDGGGARYGEHGALGERAVGLGADEPLAVRRPRAGRDRRREQEVDVLDVRQPGEPARLVAADVQRGGLVVVAEERVRRDWVEEPPEPTVEGRHGTTLYGKGFRSNANG
jgi:hypothetical protein